MLQSIHCRLKFDLLKLFKLLCLVISIYVGSGRNICLKTNKMFGKSESKLYSLESQVMLVILIKTFLVTNSSK